MGYLESVSIQNQLPSPRPTEPITPEPVVPELPPLEVPVDELLMPGIRQVGNDAAARRPFTREQMLAFSERFTGLDTTDSDPADGWVFVSQDDSTHSTDGLRGFIGYEDQTDWSPLEAYGFNGYRISYETETEHLSIYVNPEGEIRAVTSDTKDDDTIIPSMLTVTDEHVEAARDAYLFLMGASPESP